MASEATIHGRLTNSPGLKSLVAPQRPQGEFVTEPQFIETGISPDVAEVAITPEADIWLQCKIGRYGRVASFSRRTNLKNLAFAIEPEAKRLAVHKDRRFPAATHGRIAEAISPI
jgi:hypothetical protein